MEKNFLKDKGVFITGAGGGFGRKMALTFAKYGANLALNDIDAKTLDETKEIILSSFDVKVQNFISDISNFDEVKEMSKNVFNSFDNVYLLVNNAGIDGGLYKSLVAPEDVYDKVMRVNVKGMWNVTKNFYRKMKRQKFSPIKAKIINIASCAGTENGINPFIGIYSASKATVLAFTKLWALELGSSNITVNAISPGVFLTPLYKNDPTLIRKFLKMRSVKLPIDRIGNSQEVADIALFLSSSEANYITGQNVILDGGMTISINKI
ncbi:MAG: SDR family NAD(P)-dependent oxidoreductase [Candidatus Lokiarchaeota archaeon]